MKRKEFIDKIISIINNHTAAFIGYDECNSYYSCGPLVIVKIGGILFNPKFYIRNFHGNSIEFSKEENKYIYPTLYKKICITQTQEQIVEEILIY